MNFNKLYGQFQQLTDSRLLPFNEVCLKSSLSCHGNHHAIITSVKDVLFYSNRFQQSFSIKCVSLCFYLPINVNTNINDFPSTPIKDCLLIVYLFPYLRQHLSKIASSQCTCFHISVNTYQRLPPHSVLVSISPSTPIKDYLFIVYLFPYFCQHLSKIASSQCTCFHISVNTYQRLPPHNVLVSMSTSLVDRKRWVPVPHPGYHYSNLIVAVSFPPVQVKTIEHLLLGSGGNQKARCLSRVCSPNNGKVGIPSFVRTPGASGIILI